MNYDNISSEGKKGCAQTRRAVGNIVTMKSGYTEGKYKRKKPSPRTREA